MPRSPMGCTCRWFGLVRCRRCPAIGDESSRPSGLADIEPCSSLFPSPKCRAPPPRVVGDFAEPGRAAAPLIGDSDPRSTCSVGDGRPREPTTSCSGALGRMAPGDEAADLERLTDDCGAVRCSDRSGLGASQFGAAVGCGAKLT